MVTTQLAYGGSFKRALLDCQVERYAPYRADFQQEDVGFRLFERRPPESGK